VQLTGLLPVHIPLSHVSVWVQASPSLQGVPLAVAGLEQWPVWGSHVPAPWHWSEAAHTTGSPPVHTPLSQVSVWVQASPSLQGVPLAFAGLEQRPVWESHVPASWHWSAAVQTTGLLPVHTPLSHVSVRVQASPSLHGVPFALAGVEQWPVWGSHVPASWHWSEAAQTTGLLPVHTPLSHISVCVQASPSLHGVPLALAGSEQRPVCGSHVPASWHWSAAVHTTGLLPVHTPLSHMSVCVQASPSLHGVPLAFAGSEQRPV
jgi:hypothetical protein